MKFASTRGSKWVSLDEALVRGLAGDGGLFMPERLPTFALDDFATADSQVETAHVLLAPFFEESSLRGALRDILDETFTFPIPVTDLQVASGKASLMELFHGPTAAFKDVGARFLAACLSRLQDDMGAPLTLLVATSGDTGGAVAAAFDGRHGMQVVVLYPQGRVSKRQAHQLTCWGDNVLALAVKGSFDDCQVLVKMAMSDERALSRFRFSSANSINIGRLLPQCTYYAFVALEHYRATGKSPSFVVPTGNLGNGLACILARRMGLPIGEIVLATNANRLLPDYLQGAPWEARQSIHTLASAMDVGHPSNMERLTALVGDVEGLKKEVRAVSVTDEEIGHQIAEDFTHFGFATCPHTATATFAYRQLDPAARAQSDWIIAATAHPAKFERIVEPLIGEAVPLPESLRHILTRPVRVQTIAPDLQAVLAAMAQHFDD